MTEERIDIVITDKVSPGPAAKIQAIATAARKAESSIAALKKQLAAIDGSSVDKLTQAHARLTRAQTQATNAASKATLVAAKQAESSAKVALIQQKVATEASKTNVQLDKQAIVASKVAVAQGRVAVVTAQASAAQSRAAIATTNAAKAEVLLETTSTRLAITKRKEAAATDAATAAQRIANRVRQQGNRSTAQGLQQTQNLIYQLNDIVVSLASGQRPMTVFLQQGSQISTIFGPGKGVAGTLRLLGASLAGIFAPMLPAIITVGALATGFGLLTMRIRETTGVNVSFGDTFKATFQVLGRAIRDLMGDMAGIGNFFKKSLDIALTGMKVTVNAMIGWWVFFYKSVYDIFRSIPALIVDACIAAVNGVINAIQFAIDSTTAGINKLLSLSNEVSQTFGGGNLFEPIDNIDLTKFKVAYTGAMTDVLTQLGQNSQAFTVDYVGKAGSAIAAQAVVNKNKRFDEEPSVKKLIDEADALRVVGLAREQLIAVRQVEDALNRKLDGQERARINGYVATIYNLKIQDQILNDARGSLLAYTDTLRNANVLLEKGTISLAEYSAAMAKTKLVTDLRGVDAALPEYADQAAIEELRATHQERLAIVQQAMEAKILTEQEGADRIYAINTQLARDIANIEVARYSLAMNSAETAFDTLAGLSETFAGKQSGIYLSMFGMSKAFAIADSIVKIQQGIANAMAMPFPANIAAAGSVAAAAANIVSTIQSVSLTAQGRKDGGFITGPGGARSDSIPTWLSNGEFVMNAGATARNRPLLEAMNDNKPIRVGNNGSSTGGGVSVNIQNYGTSKDFSVESISPNEVRIIARDEARDVVRRDAPQVVANDMYNPNGRVSKAMSRTTTANRRRV